MATTSNPANRVPYIGKEELIRKADEFLKKYNTDDEIPVPIERIVEIKLDMLVLYQPGLKKEIGADSYLCINPNRIVIDQSQENYENRLRFTYAHELCHFLLHKDIYDLSKIKDGDGYKEFQNSLVGEEIGNLEFQAYFMAGYILMPRDLFRNKTDNKIKEEGGKDFLTANNLARIIEFLSTEFFVSEDCAYKQFIKEYPDIIKTLEKNL
ncbi:MAG: ImmA/IrrE family metallo-endopeptidase [Patescibacteria group bacterium]|nr:ImmA/IrrE family metallo-endopeptidase [Patescibacteria group bacterium]